MEITLSANAGISIEIDGRRFLIDAFPAENVGGYSCVSDEFFETLIENEHFREPDAVITTHFHKDHYSPERTQRVCRMWPGAAVIGPGETAELDYGELVLKTVALPHEGRRFSSTPNCGVIICSRGKNILIPADGYIAAPELTELIEGMHIDAAVLDFPWITLRRGRKYLEEVMKPDEVIIYHIPFPEDDENNYRKPAFESAGLITGSRVRMLTEPLQTETIEL